MEGSNDLIVKRGSKGLEWGDTCRDARVLQPWLWVHIQTLSKTVGTVGKLLPVSVKEGGALKNWCFWTVVPEKSPDSPLDCKINPVNPKGNQPWTFTGRTEAEALILWPPDGKSWLIGKDSDAGKDWRQKEKRVAENEMVGWHQKLNQYEFEQTLGDDERQGSLACCSPWGRKESDTT